MLITDPKIYTVPQYTHPHVQPESIPGMLGSRNGHGERGWGAHPAPPSSRPLGTPGWGRTRREIPTPRQLGSGHIPAAWPCPPGGGMAVPRVAREEPGTESSGGMADHGSCRRRAEGLTQGRCCQAALWLCQHSKVSWHKTHSKDLSQQSTTNSRRVFLASPKISWPFCSSCLLGLENTLIFNLKDILIIYFPF